MNPETRRLLELYRGAEVAMEKLYALCAETFPEENHFWSAISREEEVHARWVNELAAAFERGSAGFEPGKTGTAILEGFLAEIAKVHGLVKSGRASLPAAIRLAVILEKSLVEQKVFTRFSGDNEVKNTFLTKLNEATEKHVADLAGLLRKHSNQGADGERE